MTVLKFPKRNLGTKTPKPRRPAGLKNSSVERPGLGHTRRHPKQVGRMALSVGQIFKGTVPLRSGDRALLFRILAERKTFVQIRLAPIPGDAPLRTNMLWVDRSDLEFMVTTHLAIPVATMKCPSCGKRMVLADGVRSRRRFVVFACNACEEQFEV